MKFKGIKSIVGCLLLSTFLSCAGSKYGPSPYPGYRDSIVYSGNISKINTGSGRIGKSEILEQEGIKAFLHYKNIMFDEDEDIFKTFVYISQEDFPEYLRPYDNDKTLVFPRNVQKNLAHYLFYIKKSFFLGVGDNVNRPDLKKFISQINIKEIYQRLDKKGEYWGMIQKQGGEVKVLSPKENEIYVKRIEFAKERIIKERVRKRKESIAEMEAEKERIRLAEERKKQEEADKIRLAEEFAREEAERKARELKIKLDNRLREFNEIYSDEPRPLTIVDKSDKYLYLIKEKFEESYYFPIKHTNVIGPKRKRGDMKVPEGRYYYSDIHRSPKTYKFCGISYPDTTAARLGHERGDISKKEKDDIYRAYKNKTHPLQWTKLGGAIGIHGSFIPTNNGLPDGLSEGCLYSYNRFIDRLWKDVKHKDLVIIQK